jgi:catechol 2,3-dioxygenase-like lactoylglutathione lyase family enzyme
MISRIHSTTIVVADQDAALAFYTKTLGWELGMDSPMGPDMRWLTVVPPGAATQLVLSHTSWYSANNPSPANRGHTGISLACKDIDGTYATLTARGVKFTKPVEMMPWGQKGTWFRDIDDNEFFLAEE